MLEKHCVLQLYTSFLPPVVMCICSELLKVLGVEVQKLVHPAILLHRHQAGVGEWAGQHGVPDKRNGSQTKSSLCSNNIKSFVDRSLAKIMQI